MDIINRYLVIRKIFISWKFFRQTYCRIFIDALFFITFQKIIAETLKLSSSKQVEFAERWYYFS